MIRAFLYDTDGKFLDRGEVVAGEIPEATRARCEQGANIEIHKNDKGQFIILIYGTKGKETCAN
jgi:hypothetical protein